MSPTHTVPTLHGVVKVRGPWAVVEYRNGFRNAATGHPTEYDARQVAAARKDARRSDGYRATTWDYRVEPGQPIVLSVCPDEVMA